MKNVTITLDEKVARWIRVKAAHEDTSVSRLVGAYLAERMERDRGYAAAARRYRGRRSARLREPGEALPGRDELHDR